MPVEWSPKQHEHYLGEARHTMSCGLCGWLERALGRAPFQVPDAMIHDPGREKWYGNNWDMVSSPFGISLPRPDN